jgi:predicted cupin superfamily sugar epimerase
MEVAEIVSHLNLHPHPEGGYFSEHYRSPMAFLPEGFEGKRPYATSIFFLLEKGQFSALHRIKSDEIWHFYLGYPLEIVEIDQAGNWTSTILGQDLGKGQLLSYVVKAGNWFGSRPSKGSQFSLVGCTVAPGFDFQDFEMPDRNYFVQNFPNWKKDIEAFTR